MDVLLIILRSILHAFGIADKNAPRPLLLLLERDPNPSNATLLLTVVDMAASEIGVCREDLSPPWDVSRSFRCVSGDPDRVTPEDLDRLAQKTWGKDCLKNAKVSTLRLYNNSWLLAIAKSGR